MRTHFDLHSQPWLPAFFQQVADSYSEGDFIKLQALANLQETLEENSNAQASLQAKFRLLCHTR
jgi:hypothetical protein